MDDLQLKLTQLERENRKLKREISHLKHAVAQEKTAYMTILNQQKASTFIQRERDRYLALLLANSPSIIVFLNQVGRVEFCTEYFIAKAGVKSSANVLGHTLSEVISPFLDDASREKLLDQIHKSVQTNEPLYFDISFRFNQDAAAENFSGLLVPMKDEQQIGNGLMMLLHDVTDLKRSREEALAASKSKSAFLSNMSHEIRTPLNAIIGMTSIGKSDKDLSRKNYAFEKIESASEHLLGVINDILDISKIESGKMELSCIAFDFIQMLDRIENVVSLKILDKHQHFSLEIDPGIPKALFGDDQRLAQVITNLLSNAIKFTPEGGYITFVAGLESIQEGTCAIKMCIVDSGIGISIEEQDKLFNAFQQAEAGTARKYGGTGLGLTISKRILELMGGKIWVESELGKGSSFFFTVKLNVAELIGTDTEQETPGDDDKYLEYFSGKTILLVDDIDINLEILTALLESTNITMDTATCGKGAVEMFVANPGRYDLILMDMEMPEVDGLRATKIIRSLGVPQAATVPIISMTANVFKEDIQKCLDAGMNDHLGKPIEMNDVMKKLVHYLKP